MNMLKQGAAKESIKIRLNGEMEQRRPSLIH